MKKKGLILGVILIVIIFGYLLKNKGQDTNNNLNSSVSSSVGLNKVATRTISMTAEQWKFTPSELRVAAGETVKIEITNDGVPHGISIPILGINEYIPVGEVTSFTFTATEKGSFPFTCSIFCGVQHSTMVGTLIVE